MMGTIVLERERSLLMGTFFCFMYNLIAIPTT